MNDPNGARVALTRCRDAEADLRGHDGNYWSDHIGGFKAAWSDLLMYAGRAFTKSEQIAKPISQHWFGRYKHQRRTDDLLKYMWHARNVDEHGLEKVIEVVPGHVHLQATVGKPFSATPHVNERGEVTMIPGTPWTKVIENTKAKMVISSVRDQGVVYHPPKSHLGKRLNFDSPIDLVTPYLLYIDAMVGDLETNILKLS